MNETSRRGWIKNIAIVFLVILLLLTFFSNTILNYSLPEVSAQYARYDSIASALKTSGTVKANESFAVIYDEAEEGMETAEPGQTRKILSVYVKQGDTVAVGDPILALKKGATKELENAEAELENREKELETLEDALVDLEKTLRDQEKEYATGQLQLGVDNITSEIADNENKNTLASKQEKLAEKQKVYDIILAGQDPTEELKEQLKDLQLKGQEIQNHIKDINTIITEAEAKIAAAKETLGDDIYDATLGDKYSTAEREYNEIKAEHDNLDATVTALQSEYDNITSTYSDSEEIRTLSKSIEEQKKSLDEQILTLERSIESYYLNTTAPTDPDPKVNSVKDMISIGVADDFYRIYKFINVIIYYDESNLSNSVIPDMFIEYMGETRLVVSDDKDDIAFRQTVEDAIKTIAETEDSIRMAEEKLAILGSHQVDELDSYIIDTTIRKIKEELDSAKAERDALAEKLKTAKEEYETLSRKINCPAIIADNEAMIEIHQKDLVGLKIVEEEYLRQEAVLQESINEYSRDTDKLKTEIDDLAKEITKLELEIKSKELEDQKNELTTSYSNEAQAIAIKEQKADIKDQKVKIEKQKEKIEEQKQKIESIKTAPEETNVVAPIAGKIVEVNYVPGNSITSGATVARIEVADKGYVCEISMSAEEARKIQVGAECSIVNSWWYSDVEAVVAQIRSDPQSQGKNRIVVINVKGDVYEGQQLNFSIGDKSQSYESVLPNSAIREDSEGKFVLIVESKNTPLSVRYTARRMNVEIIASDDTKSAVSGLYGSEFVITSAESPISDGQQVRLAEN